MSKSKLIKYLVANEGKGTRTWIDIAEEFDIFPPKDRSTYNSEKEAQRASGKKACDIWRNYLKKSPRNLELTKASYRNGKLASETFKKKVREDDQFDYNPEDFEVIGITTHPSGGQYTKVKRKEVAPSSFNDEFIDKFINKLNVRESYIVNLNNKVPLEDFVPTIVIPIADRHLGADTKKDSMYTNRWTKENQVKRHNDVKKRIEDKINIYGKIEDLYIFDLGDSVDGWDQKTTRKSSHTLPQNLDNIGQYEAFVELTLDLMQFCVALKTEGYINKVKYLGTYNSNHGGDFEAICMKTIERLSKFYDFECEIHGKHLNYTIIQGRPYIFTHGKDYEDMKFGLPLHLNDKVTNQIKDFIRINNLDKYDYNPVVIKGDLHQDTHETTMWFSYENCPSMYGSSKWMHSNFGPKFAATKVHTLLPNTEPIRELIIHSTDQSNN